MVVVSARICLEWLKLSLGGGSSPTSRDNQSDKTLMNIRALGR